MIGLTFNNIIILSRFFNLLLIASTRTCEVSLRYQYSFLFFSGEKTYQGYLIDIRANRLLIAEPLGRLWHWHVYIVHSIAPLHCFIEIVELATI